MDSVEEREINTSELGTQSYWDKFYSQELECFQRDGEEGECWFGRPLLKRIVQWLQTRLNKQQLRCTDRILDLGCGNGLFLIELAAIGFQNLHGVDYSANAIELARGLVKQNEHEQDFSSVISLQTCDLLVVENEDSQTSVLAENNCVCIFDKGTYDAICLNPTSEFPLLELQRRYRTFVGRSLIQNGGIFILASCNWTREELLQQFLNKPELSLQLLDEIEQPKIQFGGRVGSTVTCLIFQSRHLHLNDDQRTCN